MLLIFLIIIFGMLAITKVIELKEKTTAKTQVSKLRSVPRKKWKYYSRTGVN